MLSTVIGLGVVGGLLYGNGPETEFKNSYFPKEGGTFKEMWRNMPFGFIRNETPGKIYYQNPLPYRVVNEFNDQLAETNWGYATRSLRSPAINTREYRNLLTTKFSKEEHPRIDLTRQDPTKGRHRRRQYSFYVNK